jgi:serine/threonine protein kinase/Flp pilus assembly protein TadD
MMKCSKCGFDIPGDTDSCTRCGTPVLKIGLTPTRHIHGDFDEAIALAFAPGDTFGDRYIIVEEIGRGGMGKIYKARDKELEIHVAIKMIHPELLSKPDTISRFKKEILIAREITHENVVRIYDFGEVDGVKFISMQYIDGENLAELIHASGTLGIEMAINIARQICLGLKVAHKQDIVHRDLKPQNIMIDKNGKVYITDFGLAKSLEEQGISKSGIVMGTPQYLSPEQAMGEKVDQRSDIYMLGIIMYEMITGKELFYSETIIGYLQKHIQQKPTSPSTINLLIPPYFEKIILKCLEKERSDRYKNADDLLKDLQKEKVVSGSIFLSFKSRKILKRIAATFLLLIAAAAVLYVLINLSPPESKDNRKSVAIMPFAIRTTKIDLAHWRETLQDLLITELYQSRHFRILSGRHLYEILKELDILNNKTFTLKELRQVASRGNISHIIDGTLAEMGKVFNVNVKIWEVKTERETPFEFEPVKNVDSFPKLVDSIGKRIREEFLSFDERLTDSDKQIGKITTVSPEAYRYYFEGKKNFWEGKYQKSNEAMEKAIRLDSKFAMAYRRIASNYSYLGLFQKTVNNIEKAFKFKDRASERERYLIEAYYYRLLEKHPEKAINICRKLLELYPEDEDGIAFLGAIYRNLENWDLAEVQFQNLLRINNRYQLAYLNLGHIYFAKGKCEQTWDLLQNNKGIFLKLKSYNSHMAKYFLYLGNFERALIEIEEAISLDPNEAANIEYKGHIHQLKGDFLKSENAYKKLINSKEAHSQTIGQLSLINLYLLEGKNKKCMEEINRALHLCAKSHLEEGRLGFLICLAYTHLKLKNPEAAINSIKHPSEGTGDFNFVDSFTIRKFSLHLQGWAYLQMGKIKKAKDTAVQLEQLIKETGHLKKMRLFYHLHGLICLEEKKIEEAIEYFEKALALLPHQLNAWDNTAFYLEPLAAAYYEKNNFKKAVDLYKEIQALTIGRLKWGDIYTRSFYHLGKIYHKLDEKRKAKTNYRKFLTLWKNADQHIPEIADAKKQLAYIN